MMTEDQRKLVEDNHELIYYYIHSHLQHNVDDWYDILAISLCKAAMSYDESKGYKFATYAVSIFRNTVKQEYRDTSAAKRIPEALLCHFEDTIDESADNFHTLSELIPSDYNLESESLINLSIERAMNNLEGKYKQIFSLRLEGYDHQTIASVVGYSQSYVSRVLKGIYKEYFI